MTFDCAALCDNIGPSGGFESSHLQKLLEVFVTSNLRELRFSHVDSLGYWSPPTLSVPTLRLLSLSGTLEIHSSVRHCLSSPFSLAFDSRRLTRLHPYRSLSRTSTASSTLFPFSKPSPSTASPSLSMLLSLSLLGSASAPSSPSNILSWQPSSWSSNSVRAFSRFDTARLKGKGR
jgi:hypothetical protein